jgi:hypothetical protein
VTPLRTVERNDLNPLCLEIDPPPRSQRLDRDLVAYAFDNHKPHRRHDRSGARESG